LYQRYRSLVHERSQLFSSVAVPCTSGYGCCVIGSTPVRGMAQRATKLASGGQTPWVQGSVVCVVLVGLPEPPPPPPQAAREHNANVAATEDARRRTGLRFPGV